MHHCETLTAKETKIEVSICTVNRKIKQQYWHGEHENIQ